MARTDELKEPEKGKQTQQTVSDDLDGDESCSDDRWMQFRLSLNEEVENDMLGKSRPAIRRSRPPLRRFEGRVFLRSHDEALKFAHKYSQRREADGILALFTDGSASEPRLVLNKNTPAISPSSDEMDIDDDDTTTVKDKQKKKKKKGSGPRWCSCSVVYRPKPNDLFWERRGFALGPEIEGNTDAELAGLANALEVVHDVFANDAGVRTALVFCDSALLLRRLTTLATAARPDAPDWNGTYLRLLVDYADLLVSVFDKDLQFHWVPAHAGVLGNEIADRTAHEHRPDVCDPGAHPVVGAHERRLAAHRRGRQSDDAGATAGRRRHPRLRRPSGRGLDADSPRLSESSSRDRRHGGVVSRAGSYGGFGGGPRVTGANASPVAVVDHHHHDHHRADSRGGAPHVTGANALPMLELHRRRASERRENKRAYRLGSLDHHGSRSGRHYWDRDRPM
ncbi:hypothetical protein SLS58_005077 [Diplodia intermedia]|uniref:RNase H type-1 domain-containing protein n=1 Tax=Diplodia intermedia TaxID=856260 RepID=A0ABR3TS87_9PEZI